MSVCATLWFCNPTSDSYGTVIEMLDKSSVRLFILLKKQNGLGWNVRETVFHLIQTPHSSLFTTDSFPPSHQRGERQTWRGIALPSRIPSHNQFLLGTRDPYVEQAQALLDVICA